MPELPEVETVCRGLRPLLVGQRINQVELFRPNLRLPFPLNLAEVLEGQQIVAINRRAKYILILLERDDVLLMHLGMSGKVVVYPLRRNQRLPHDHALFILENGSEMAFNDARRFGLITLTTQTLLHQHPLLSSLGPEPLEEAFTADYLHSIFQGKTSPVKTALMDNHNVVGVGNIYACESLFVAGIAPGKPAGSLTKPECIRLVTAIREVLEAALIAGGSTLKDYVQAKGEAGYFQHQFQVYGREGEACYRCGTLIARIRQAGRSSFYCPHCQNNTRS